MSAKPKGAGGSTKGAKHSSLTVAEWRTLLAEFFAAPWFGQQAESFVFAKNRDRKAENAKRKKEDELTLIVLQTFKNKASKEKKAAAKEEREPGQFQTLAPVAPDAKRIKTTEWAEVEDKVIELFDLSLMHLPTRKVGLSWRYVLERARRWAGELYTADKAARFHASAGWLQKVLNRRNYTSATMRGEAGEADEEYECGSYSSDRAREGYCRALRPTPSRVRPVQ
jgi:hypothetical protein